jgi:hypothetical protein
MPINPFGAAGYVTNRLQPRDGNGGILRQYQDAGSDFLSATQSYVSDGIAKPNIYAVQCLGATGTVTLVGNNQTSTGAAAPTYAGIPIPSGSTIYGDFSTVTAGAATTLLCYKKLLP